MHRILPILDQNLHQNFGEKNWQAKTTSEKGFVLKTIFGPFRAQIEPKCQRGGSFIRGPQLKIISIMDERVDLTPFSIQWIGIQKLFSKPGHYFKSAKTKKCWSSLQMSCFDQTQTMAFLAHQRNISTSCQNLDPFKSNNLIRNCCASTWLRFFCIPKRAF